jgi:ribose 5-phosphate isomerase A
MNKSEILESDDIKKAVSERATTYIKDGMIIGLGSGSTVKFMLNEIGRLISQGLQIIGVSTSKETSDLAHSYKIPLLPVEDVREIDLTIDGADQVDRNGNGIKGRHGAFLKEKMVAGISKKNIWIITESKMTDYLGKIPLPVEVLKDNYELLIDMFKLKNIRSELRQNSGLGLIEPIVTENGNYIIDLFINIIDNPYELETFLKSLPGLVETGLFLNVADKVLVGKYNFDIEIIDFEKV